MREREIKGFITNELKRFFHIMSEEEILESIQNYESVKDKNDRARKMSNRELPPTDYNKEVMERFVTRQRAMKAITKKVQNKVVEKFGIREEKKIEGTKFLIDLFDEEEKTCYEIALGDGTEIFKDIIKSLLVGANKLVIFCRSYPNPWGMIGYDYIKRQWEMMKDKVKLEVEIIEFISSMTSR